MSTLLKMNFKRTFSQKSTWIALGMIVLILILDYFLVRTGLAFDGTNYEYYLAIEMFSTYNGESLFIIFLPFIIFDLNGDSLLSDRLGEMDKLATVRSSRPKYLTTQLLSSLQVLS